MRIEWPTSAGAVMTGNASAAARLVDELVERLNAVTPASFVVEAVDHAAGLTIFLRDDPTCFATTYVGEILRESPRDAANIEAAVLIVLDTVQDFISESLTVPWPAGSRDSVLLAPGVDVAEDQVSAWFGPAQAPVLALSPIPRNKLADP